MAVRWSSGDGLVPTAAASCVLYGYGKLPAANALVGFGCYDISIMLVHYAALMSELLAIESCRSRHS